MFVSLLSRSAAKVASRRVVASSARDANLIARACLSENGVGEIHGGAVEVSASSQFCTFSVGSKERR